MNNEPASDGLNSSDFDGTPDTASVPPRPPPPPGPVADLAPGDFGDYQFVERLGKGAFGVVFKVWSLSKTRYEAMKILQTKGKITKDLLDAFKLEVQRMANVPGAEVAHVYHTGALPDGRPFFTMEYVSGGQLDRFCTKNRLSLDDRIRLMAEVCDGVHSLHELKLVHCDLKPGNILVAENGGKQVPKMVDFGLARHLGFRLAPTRFAAGTLPYMSPEQLESKSEDPESGWDIYALGVTLYELLVGDRPIDPLSDVFARIDLAAERVRRTPIPPLLEKLSSTSHERSDELARERRLTPDALRKRLGDPWLEAVVDKALAKHRDDRFATAADMGRNLRSCLAGRRPPIVPARPRDRVREFARDRWLAISIPTVLLIIAGLLFSLSSTTAARDRAEVKSLVHEGCSLSNPAEAMLKFEQALSLAPTRDPSRSEILLHFASAYLGTGDAASAIEIASEIAEEDEHYHNAQAFIAGVNEFRGAETISSDSSRVPPDFTRGGAYYYSLSLGPERAALAVDVLTDALRNARASFEEIFRFRLLRAKRYFQLSRLQPLDEETKWLVETADTSAAAWNLRGTAALYNGRLDEALMHFDRALALNPRFAAVYRNRADVKNEKGSYVSALADCQKALKADPSFAPFAQATRIRAQSLMGNFAAAQRECASLEHGEKTTMDTHLQCGEVWSIAKDYERAWTEFDTALDMSRRYHDADAEYHALRKRGGMATMRGRHEESLVDLRSAEARSAEKWAAELTNYEARAFVCLLAGQQAGAVQDLKAIAESPQGKPFHYLLMWDALRTQGEPAAAEAALAKAVELAETDEWWKAVVAHCKGSVDRSAVLAHVAGNANKAVEAYYYLGLASKARGNVLEAIECFQTCRELQTGQIEEVLAEMQLARLIPATRG